MKKDKLELLEDEFKSELTELFANVSALYGKKTVKIIYNSEKSLTISLFSGEMKNNFLLKTFDVVLPNVLRSNIGESISQLTFVNGQLRGVLSEEA